MSEIKVIIMAAYNYFTREKLQELKDELNELKSKGRAEVAKQIQEAREKGDLSENAEYDAAKEEQGMLEMKISKLEDTISNAKIVDDKDLDTSKALILTTVELENKKTGKRAKYTLVSEEEANVKEKKISVTSPIGKGVLGKQEGDEVEVETPKGHVTYKIVGIARE